MSSTRKSRTDRIVLRDGPAVAFLAAIDRYDASGAYVNNIEHELELVNVDRDTASARVALQRLRQRGLLRVVHEQDGNVTYARYILTTDGRDLLERWRRMIN
jgi:hypothetical protein